MITVNLMGRMGNNLFQIAAALSLSKIHNTDCFITDDIPGHIKDFNLSEVGFSNNRSKNVYKEYKYQFNEEFNALEDNTHLCGYFQSHRYFEKYSKTIKENFSFKNHVRDNVSANGYGDLEIEDNNFTAIHIRRTDYLEIQHAHPLCGIDYYNKCLEEICPKDKIFVFSDDLEWCRQNFNGNSFIFITLDHHCCLYMMTRVKNLVIANSTFSWWGAWLNGRKDKNVYSPKKWFGNTFPYRDADISLENCTRDIYPQGWNIR